jgi:hypothetical protein
MAGVESEVSGTAWDGFTKKKCTVIEESGIMGGILDVTINAGSWI